MTIKPQAAAIALKCEDAYSSYRYASWAGVAQKRLARGLDAKQVEAIMRSKWTRWAADASNARSGKVPAKAIIDFIDDSRNKINHAKIVSLTQETFGN